MGTAYYLYSTFSPAFEVFIFYKSKFWYILFFVSGIIAPRITVETNESAPINFNPSWPTSGLFPRSKSNEPQAVLEKPWKQLLKTFWIHLVPLLCCIFLIWLDRAQIFWFADNRPTTFNALQLAAKLLELFILASISAMILHHARRHLIDDTGLPYGLLSAAYQATNIMLLFEPSLWASSLSHRKTLRLGFLMLIVALYSVLVGPSCAIMMIPNPDFYPHPRAFSNETARLLFFRPEDDFEASSAHTKDYIYPTNLFGNATFNATYCAESHPEDSDYRRCPGGKYDNVLGWAWKDLGYDLGLGNISTVYEPGSRFRYQAVSSLVEDGKTAATVMAAASVPHESLIRTFGSLWNHFQLPSMYGRDVNVRANRTVIQVYASESSPVFEPVVQARCTFFGDARNSNSSEVQLNGDGMLSFAQGRGWRLQQDTAWSIPQTAIDNVLKPSANVDYYPQYFVEWIDAATVNASGSFSVAALVSAPLGLEEGSSYENRGARFLIPCVFSAYWMPATFVFDSQASVSVQSNWSSSSTNPMAEAIQAIQAIQNGENPNTRLPQPLGLVNIGADWASMLHGIDGLLLDMLNPQLDSSYYAVSNSPLAAWTFLSRIVPGLTAAFSVGLANFGVEPAVLLYTSKSESLQDFGQPSVSAIIGTHFPPPSKSGPIPDIYEISAEVNRYGYAFGARTPTVRFGFAILLIYVGVLGVYVLYALWDQLNKHPYAITSFGGSHDIITLAMNSRPPKELVNCGAGTKDRNTWRQLIKVRAHKADENEPNKLELVFKEWPDLERVRKGQKYG